MKGKYIVFEGGEGCGKTTTCKSLQEKFPDAVFVQEPGGTELGKKLKETIFSIKRSGITNAYLFASARAEIIETIVKPALEAGKLVISDRSFISSIVYQGVLDNFGVEKILEINKPALQGITPDICVFFSVSYETSYIRTHDRFSCGGEFNYYDSAGIKFFNEVNKAYQNISQYGINNYILDANQENPQRVEELIKLINAL